ncbi:MAG TPA: pyridoxamine 5'-phosphate oxidase [Gemmatimonadaceae bacterium]|nr:pyridoxamine 5'-phosphate oxidase [Gemmatimonadaceae bacterium]
MPRRSDEFLQIAFPTGFMTTAYPVQNPLSRFNRLYAQAQKLDRAVLPEPNAMSLATVGMSGNPSVRIVLLKSVDERGFVFYTNLDGRKGRELRTHPVAAICFHWAHLEVQVRAEGIVEQVSNDEADAYFATRPRESQIGAWASIQSQPIEHASDLADRFRQYETEFEGREVPRPSFWSGFRLRPSRIEFWKSRPGRLHERHLYTRSGESWTMETLYP